MSFGRQPLNRRALFTSAIAVGTAVVLSACSENDELADQAGSDQGYVSGSGVVSRVPAEDRGEPLDLSFETLDGKSMSLADLRPTPVVVNLWYAACPPCRKEAPDLKSVSEELGDKAQFLGVNVRDQEAAANAFIQSFQVPYPNMLDSNGEMVSLLSGVLPPQATPSTVILDAKGRAAARVVGEVDASTLKGLVEDVLAE
ncbi:MULTISPECIES: TlpA family protein disulfide reductase [Brevibacterium]|jgi:peroxiredoxin|uniref:Alkyl hydroperoxide reductase/ Thiol specific antioxidant/ Mal allergen n=2 Tax=Brevibacterium TaxID=1696 RepID=A0A0B9A5Z1_BRELN|nr:MULTISPECIES: TlpA disulfide reductase family protein [Brevibacterium]KHS54149.1 alkyl hydroperoxide reductase/ Thiol specific antioxidant/ Mal allergen [Brevibacterium linens]HJE77104.1 TlpA family protein disulfide reductase [Brevibacterium epidermidis]